MNDTEKLRDFIEWPDVCLLSCDSIQRTSSVFIGKEDIVKWLNNIKLCVHATPNSFDGYTMTNDTQISNRVKQIAFAVVVVVLAVAFQTRYSHKFEEKQKKNQIK